jgi:hypothetical protein
MKDEKAIIYELDKIIQRLNKDELGPKQAMHEIAHLILPAEGMAFMEENKDKMPLEELARAASKIGSKGYSTEMWRSIVLALTAIQEANTRLKNRIDDPK